MGEEPSLTQFNCWLCSPWGKKVVSLGSTFLICTVGVLWYVEGVIQFEFPHFSLDT